MGQDRAAVVHALTEAYKSLIKIPKEPMTAAQQAHLLETEQYMIKALVAAPDNRIERVAVRAFIERMLRRDTEATF